MPLATAADLFVQQIFSKCLRLLSINLGTWLSSDLRFADELCLIGSSITESVYTFDKASTRPPPFDEIMNNAAAAAAVAAVADDEAAANEVAHFYLMMILVLH